MTQNRQRKNPSRVPFAIPRMFQDMQLDEMAIREMKAMDAQQAAAMAREINTERAKSDAEYFGALALWCPDEATDRLRDRMNNRSRADFYRLHMNEWKPPAEAIDRVGAMTVATTYATKSDFSSTRDMIDKIKFLSYDIPKERFTTYEPSDLGWMEYFGLAKKRPTFDTVIVPPGTKVKQSAAGTFRVCESEHCPEGVGYLMDSKAYAVDSLPMLTAPVVW